MSLLTVAMSPFAVPPGLAPMDRDQTEEQRVWWNSMVSCALSALEKSAAARSMPEETRARRNLFGKFPIFLEKLFKRLSRRSFHFVANAVDGCSDQPLQE